MADVPEPLVHALRHQYVVERELGRGGMAVVYMAHDLKHDRPVAVKVLHPSLAATLGSARFLSEIRIAARLQHPHILSVHDSGEYNGLVWFSMPYIEGESLRGRLQREMRLPIEVAVSICREAAEALDYAHSRQILHRDIKPENILLSRGHALVADFGIAKALDVDPNDPTLEHLTGTGMSLGTPAYMSPEQATGERGLDSRSDVYSLGCVLYEMLTGEPPFSAPTVQGLIAKRFIEPAPSVRRLRDEVPPVLERVVERSLARLPADRFPSAAALADALASPAMWSPLPEGTPLVEGRRTDRSVAVLPFASLSPDPENEYFADGMTDELINAFAKVKGLHVVSRTSVFAYKGKPEDARAIGARLQVRSVLEGSVRRSGRRLRVAAQLINVADGFLLCPTPLTGRWRTSSQFKTKYLGPLREPSR
jgi:eukaryotic-like serine/threonine-protein kinase